MAILIQQAFKVIADTAASSLHSKKWLLSVMTVSALMLSACQTAPISSTTQTPTTTINKERTDRTVTTANTNEVYVGSEEQLDNQVYAESYEEGLEEDYPIEPYQPSSQPSTSSAPIPPSYEQERYNDDFYSSDDEPESLNQSDSPYNIPPLPTPSSPNVPVATPPALPSHSDLLERARQNSQQQSRASTSSSSDLPAFRNLMQLGTSQLQAGNLTAAENTFTRAQRLAPRSSAVYFYLSQVALKKNQPRKAEAMARRGLTVSQDANRRRALWQLILRSGQAQNNTRVIKEAQQALR